MPWLSGEVTIPYDAKAHFQAQIQFLANALHRGDSPFWTPNVFGGSPQIADPQSLIFSPAILLALFDAAPSFRAMDAYVLSLLLFGAFAVVQFGRERGWHPAAQAVAALVLAFGASASWRLQHIGQVRSLAFFAVALWLLSRALRHGSWRSGLVAGLAAGLMVATPDQIALLGVYVLSAYALWHLLRDGAPLVALRRVWPALATGAVAGIAVVAGPLLLAYLFSQVSNRAEIDFAEAARGSLHPAFLLTAFIGDLFGAADPKVEFWGPSSSAWAPNSLTLSQNMGQVYVGALPLIAVIAFALRGWKAMEAEARFMLAALGAMVVYALGSFTPLFALLFDWAPGVDMFRRPADATFMIGALMAFLSGFALDALLARPDWRGDRLRLAATGLAVVAIGAIAALVAAGIGQSAARPILIGLGWCALAVGLIAAASRFGGALAHPGRALAVALALGLVAGADLKANNGPNESTALPPKHYAVMEPDTDNDTIGYLKAALARGHREPARRDRVELLGTEFHWPNLGMIHNFDHAFGYNPLHLAEFSEATGARDHMGQAKDRTFTPMFPSYRSTFADLLGLRYIVSAVPIEQVDRSLKPGDLQLKARTRDGFIYENHAALPRAMFVENWKLADFEQLREKGFPSDFDPRAAILLESAPDDPPLVAGHAGQGSAPLVRLASYANTQVVVEVDSPRPGFVLLNDVWHPWWTASVDGREVELLKANALFRAVAVPAGRSSVTFAFRPLEGAIAELREKMLGEEEEWPRVTAMIR